MRVIAGKARSMNLKTIQSLDTRPTTDRIKETLFNVLSFDIVDNKFLDLFAGSGAIGIEALSRGASGCDFVENSHLAIKCIQDNLNFTRLNEFGKVYRSDVISFVSQLREINYDIIFMDPPYKKELEKQVMTILSQKVFVKDTIIVIEADKKEDFSYLEELNFEIYKTKEYKTNKHIFVIKKD